MVFTQGGITVASKLKSVGFVSKKTHGFHLRGDDHGSIETQKYCNGLYREAFKQMGFQASPKL